MFFRLAISCGLCLALFPAGSGQLCAAPVLGNLTIPATDRAVPVTHHSWQASSFRLAETAGAWRVQQVSLRLAQEVPNGSFTVRLVGESAFRPDLSDVVAQFRLPALITGATAPTPGAAASSVVFEAAVSPEPVLQPGRTYWLVAGVAQLDNTFTPATGLYYWSYANAGGVDPGTEAGWAFGAATASAGTLGSGWSPEATTPFTFSIDAIRETPPVTLAAWRLTHPGGPEDPVEFLSSDPDRDGSNGLLEFAFNGSPTQPDQPGPAGFTDSMGRPGMEFVRWVSSPDIRYDVQWSGNLAEWSAPDAGSVMTTVELLPNGMERVRVALVNAGPRRFLRVQVSRI